MLQDDGEEEEGEEGVFGPEAEKKIQVERCPCCEREVRGIEDYPKIFIADFKKIKIPTDQIISASDREHYVGPKGNPRCPRTPPPVVDYFRDNQKKTEFIYDGWNWVLQSRDSGFLVGKSETSRLIGKQDTMREARRMQERMLYLSYLQGLIILRY